MAEDKTPVVTSPALKELFPTKVESKEEPVKEELEYQKILRENGGLEANIPINSPYWRLRP